MTASPQTDLMLLGSQQPSRNKLNKMVETESSNNNWSVTSTSHSSIAELAQVIVTKDAESVALQFPDSLLTEAPIVCVKLQ